MKKLICGQKEGQLAFEATFYDDYDLVTADGVIACMAFGPEGAKGYELSVPGYVFTDPLSGVKTAMVKDRFELYYTIIKEVE